MKLRNMMVWVAAPLILSGCGLVDMANIPGESNADTRLKMDVIKMMAYAVPLQTGCNDPITFRNVKKTRVSIPRQNSSWQEIWTINACGIDSDMKITFADSPRGGTDLLIAKG